MWCGSKNDVLSEVETRVKTAFLMVFQNICQASRLWHNGGKENTKAKLSNSGDPQNPIKAEVNKIYHSGKSVPSFHSPTHVLLGSNCMWLYHPGMIPCAWLSGLTLPFEIGQC